MKIHNLKIFPKYLDEILLGLKKVEIRKNDRNYEERDLLILSAWCPLKQEFLGVEAVRKIDYIISGVPGLEEGYVILQISKPL